MPILQVAFKATAPKVALVQADGAALPSGYLDAGSFDHPDPVYPGSVVLFHGVRDLLYHFNQLDMAVVDIQLADGIVASYVTEIDVVWGGHDLRVNDPLYDSERLVARAWPPGAADVSLTYASSKPEVVTVDEDGVLTAVSEGTSVITITAPGSAGATKLKKEVTVTVGGKKNIEIIAVTGVDLTPATASLVVGATRQLTAAVAPADASNKAVTYTSNAPSIATVSATGLVTAVAAGSATITAKTTDGDKTDTSVITVTAA